MVLVSSLWYRTQSGWEDRATAGAPVDVGATESCVCVWSTALLSPACTDATLFLFQIITADFSLQSCHSRRLARRHSSSLFFFWIICVPVCVLFFFFISVWHKNREWVKRQNVNPHTRMCFPLLDAKKVIKISNFYSHLHNLLCWDHKSHTPNSHQHVL